MQDLMLLLLILFILFGPFILVSLLTPAWLYRQGRPRSYYNGNKIIGGETSRFVQREDGSWYDSRTGEELQSCTLSDLGITILTNEKKSK